MIGPGRRGARPASAPTCPIAGLLRSRHAGQRRPPDQRRDHRRRDRRPRAAGERRRRRGAAADPRTRARRSPRTSAAASTRRARSSRPGFIDLHSHGGLWILAEPRHEPKVRQGVTTEIVGVDGNGFAPFHRRADLRRLRRARQRARRPAAHRLRLGLGRRATSRASTARSASTSGRSSATRRSASTPSAGTTCPPTSGRIDRMRGLLRESMAEGAVGLSSGLDYPPGGYATTEELAALTAEAGRSGGFYHTPRPLHARRPLPRPVPRGDRDRPAGRRAQPHHALLPPRDASRAGRADARPWSTTPAPKASTSPSTRIRPSGPARAC